jgi:hypothetical protein
VSDIIYESFTVSTTVEGPGGSKIEKVVALCEGGEKKDVTEVD